MNVRAWVRVGLLVAAAVLAFGPTGIVGTNQVDAGSGSLAASIIRVPQQP